MLLLEQSLLLLLLTRLQAIVPEERPAGLHLIAMANQRAALLLLLLLPLGRPHRLQGRREVVVVSVGRVRRRGRNRARAGGGGAVAVQIAHDVDLLVLIGHDVDADVGVHEAVEVFNVFEEGLGALAQGEAVVAISASAVLDAVEEVQRGRPHAVRQDRLLRLLLLWLLLLLLWLLMLLLCLLLLYRLLLDGRDHVEVGEADAGHGQRLVLGEAYLVVDVDVASGESGRVVDARRVRGRRGRDDDVIEVFGLHRVDQVVEVERVDVAQ